MKIKSNKVIIQFKKFKCNSKVSKCRMEGCKKVRSVFGAGKNAGTKKKYGRCKGRKLLYYNKNRDALHQNTHALESIVLAISYAHGSVVVSIIYA